jgi:hypothetical protein
MVMAVLAKVREDKACRAGGALLKVLEKCITCCELYGDCAKRELPLPSLLLLLLLLEPMMRGLVCLACASMRLLLCLLAVPVSIIIFVVAENEWTSVFCDTIKERESDASLDGWLWTFSDEDVLSYASFVFVVMEVVL